MTTMRSIFSILAFGFAIVGVSMLTIAAPARAEQKSSDPDAEKFISDLAAKAVSILDNPNASLQEKKNAFGQIVLDNADIQEIGYFTLGRYKRLATPAQLDEFSKLYEQYTRNFYESRLSEYSGQQVKVTDSVVLPRNHVVVYTVFSSKDGSDLDVNWLLEKTNGTYVIRDLEVSGISLASEQRSQFTSIIANNGGRFQALLTKLGDVVAHGGSFDLESQIQSN